MNQRTSPAPGRSWQNRTPSPAALARLRAVFEGYRGASHTIKARDLAVVLGIHDPTGRTVRELVNALIEQGVPIGSINLEAGGGGYFLIDTEQELERFVRSLQSRAREILKKAERVREAFHCGPKQPALM